MSHPAGPSCAAAVAIALLLVACSGASSGTGSATSVTGATATPFPAALRSDAPFEPTIDAADFVAQVDNPYFPLVPGSRWVMEGEGESAGEVTTTEVTSDTKTILGVVCTRGAR